jgi:error-prone DNA polymerase
MVHPYLRRRQGLEPVDLPSPLHGPADELEQVLGRTMGVPLFQEQAMQIAIVAAQFTPEEANQLRRSMATFRNAGTIHRFFEKMVKGMVARGYTQDFAERCFHQIEGFGTYGFPESHSASFALLVYVSSWLKCHHPAAFACALLNSQPMGFYAPAQIVRDAREHGVEVRPIDVCASDWDCTLEEGTLRLGFRLINGFSREWAERVVEGRGGGGAAPSLHPPPARGGRVFFSWLRLGVPRAALVLLAEADALRSLKLDRRAALWQVRGLSDIAELPLFADQPVAINPGEINVPLPVMTKGEHVITDYQTAGLSLKSHPMRFLRELFASEGVLSCAQAAVLADGARLSVAGVVLVRQRPGNGNVVFCTIEDETGIANIVVWASLLERFRRAILGSSLVQVTGRLQRSPEGIIHVIADRLQDCSALMARVSEVSPPAIQRRLLRSPGHPRQERVVPRSRDFR